METWREAHLSTKWYHKAARRFFGVFKKETEFSWCSWQSVEKPHNGYFSQLYNFWKLLLIRRLQAKELKIIFWSTSLTLHLHFVFDILLICFFYKWQRFFDKIWCWHVCILTKEKKSLISTDIGRWNRSSQTVLIDWPFCLFIFWCTVEKNGFWYSLVLNISA